jgi:two-component system response regulator RegX3
VSESHTILVIEDEPNLVSGLRDALAHHGYTVLAAATGPKGLECAMTGQADLILLDVMLPGMTGLEVCTELRQRGVSPHREVAGRGQDRRPRHGCRRLRH